MSSGIIGARRNSVKEAVEKSVTALKKVLDKATKKTRRRKTSSDK